MLCAVAFFADAPQFPLAPGGLRYNVAANSETASLCGSLCAERTALAALAALPEFPTVAAVYLVSDAEEPLFPGTLCREYMLECMDPETLLVLGSADGQQILERRLGDIYPFPPLFPRIHRSRVMEKAAEFARGSTAEFLQEAGPEWQDLLEHAAREIAAWKNNCELHPLKMVAVARFPDGEIQVTRQTIAYEFGASMDPVSKLFVLLEDTRNRGERNCGGKVLIVQMDQFGNCHPPNARARALLVENGFGDAQILMHNAFEGKHCIMPCRHLVPNSPELAL